MPGVLSRGFDRTDIRNYFGEKFHSGLVSEVRNIRVTDVRELTSTELLIEFEAEISASFSYGMPTLMPTELVRCVFQVTYDRNTKTFKNRQLKEIERYKKPSETEPYFCYPHGASYRTEVAFFNHIRQEHGIPMERMQDATRHFVFDG
jgi:hypothetical protein